MITYTDTYGADADGNKGIPIIEHEIEKSDFDEIHAQVLENIAALEEDEETPDEMDIILICPISEEDITFTITTKDYL